MPKIRVMHVVDNLGRGGLENGLVNLIEHLNRNRFEHVVCAVRRMGPHAERLESGGSRVICLASKAKSQLFTLARTIREVKPDVVHSRNWAGIEAVIAARMAGCRAVVHSEHGLEANTQTGEPWRRKGIRRLAFELANRVLSVSYQLRELHAARTGFSARRITVIHNGVDTGRFCPDPAEKIRKRRDWGIAEDEFCIGCVGNLSPTKDYLTTLKAVDRFAESSSRKWRLMVAGDGPERAALEAFVQSCPRLQGQATFLGQCGHISEFLGAMDAYVLSSVIEGISNSLLEAMASGLPAVASAVGGNPEVVVNGESGLLFPAGDFAGLTKHLLMLANQEDVRRRLGEEARTRVAREFSIDCMVQKYEEVYEGLTGPEPAWAAVTV